MTPPADRSSTEGSRRAWFACPDVVALTPTL